MRTNIVIDDDLIEKAKRATGMKTKREIVEAALALLVEEKSRVDLWTLRGKIEFAEGYDYKKQRKEFDRDFS